MTKVRNILGVKSPRPQGNFGPANVFLDLNPSGVPSNPYFESCLNALAYKGRVVIQGNLSQPLTISPFNFRFKNLTVRSKTMYTRDEAKDLIRLAESGALKYWAMHRIQKFAFEEFEKAFSAAETATSWDDLVVLDLA
ncbi:hypothetical protein KL938_002993 [Ogataea parapolymorpha]|nr:hypothetical protein KL938_002993 [Ogataea parapolymorpha]